MTDIQYRCVCILHISASLITVARVRSTLHPCSSNQCDTARLESKLTSIQIMHISSHEIVHSFLYDTQRPSYQNPQRRHVAVRLRNEERPSVFFGTLPVFRTSRSPSFLTPLTILKITHFSATHLFQLYCTYLHIMMRFDHDKFLPPVVKLSTTPYCTYISSSQYDGTHYNDSTQYGNQYTSTDCTSLPLHGDSPRTCPSNVSAHNARQIDSAHFVVSMPYDRHTSPSLVAICNDRPTDSIHIVPYVDTLGSRQCNTEHTSTGGVARNGNVLVTNSNPASTHASTGSVNPYPNNMKYSTGSHAKYLQPATTCCKSCEHDKSCGCRIMIFC